MINLRSLMDLLPYYFKEQDTYKVNGKGLLERYLDIFGTYFDNQVVKDISTLDDIIDIDKTPEVYLGYLWEFLGSMPYANPKAIDPDKWKQYFNGFESDSTIESLSRLWLYRKDSDGDHYTLTLNQVRSLVKYSIALFSIRGTKKFFEVFLRLYGFEVNISNDSTYPKITLEEDDDSDYWGSDVDYFGTDDDYGGSIDSLFDIKTEPTKLDSEWLNLDTDTVDNHTNCTRLVNVNFRLKSDYVYNVYSNEFKRLQDRMFNLINMFLPIGTRPHIIWDNVNVGDGYESKVTRSIEVYVNRTPIDWSPNDNVFVESNEYPGWYRVYEISRPRIPLRNFDWLPLKFMVKVKDTGGTPAFISDQPKKFVVAFNGKDFSDTEYEDGHIFIVKPRGDSIYYPKFKISVLCEEDFDLTDGSLNTFIIASWLKYFNYTLFKHYNHSVDLIMSPNNTYVPILIQSASVRTYTNDANPDDDDFDPQQVVNLTTGEYLTLCENGTTLPDREGSDVDYSQYEDMCMYVQHIFEPGVYEFAMLNKPEYRFTIEVKVVKEVLTLTLVNEIHYTSSDFSNLIRHGTKFVDVTVVSSIFRAIYVELTVGSKYKVVGNNIVGLRTYNVKPALNVVATVQHIYTVGYEFTAQSNDLYLEIYGDTTVGFTGATLEMTGVTSEDIVVDNENPTARIKLKVTSNLAFLDHENTLIIKETTNPVTRYWNNEDVIVLKDPGHYRFFGVNPNNPDNVISNYIDVNVLSNKYNAHYYLELEDEDKSDDEDYMIRTLIANRPTTGSTVTWGFDFLITVDKSVIEAQDILIIDPNAFDLEVLIYRGGTPNRGTLLGSWTADTEILTDDLGNILPHYKVKGHVNVTWDGTYTTGTQAPYNFPPGLYCVELHDKNHLWNGSPSYRVLDAYVIPQKFDGNLYFDVDVISKAWTSPAGQIYDIDPITGKRTWGWFKTNDDYKNSVRLVRYDPAIGIPQFRLKLTNNTIGYTRVYMYKLVDNGVEWDSDAAYSRVLPPMIKSKSSHSFGIDNPHWLDEAIPNEWGFPGEYNEDTAGWDYSKGDTGIVDYRGRWLFTGSVYQLGELISGPQEPGKYLFLINQLTIDTNIINYAYLEVREEVQYSMIVDPSLVILGDTAVGIKVDAVSSARFTKEVLGVSVVLPDGVEVKTYYRLPYTYYAYRLGSYSFKLYKFENGSWIYLGLSASFKVISDSGISRDYLDWEWSDLSEKEVTVASTDSNAWSISIQS